ncbi:MAG: fibronectin type III domain-containing protein [Clostridia bacterium]|nr:fibronectin type III domain-containing protein [Clostridia bacterium]
MKTVFNRALSLVMCLVLICSTMSVMAFGANAAEDFNYKTYAQNATKENVHHLFDFLDDVLEDANGAQNNLKKEVNLFDKSLGWLEMQAVEFVLGLFVKSDALIVGKDYVKLSLDLSSVDAICKTVDNYRTVIALATNDTLNGLINLGDLGDINLDVFDEGLSRSKSGDVKIFSEVLQLAAANSTIIGKLLSDDGVKLGVIGDAINMKNIKFDVSTLLREGIVNAIFDESDANYADAMSKAKSDFDKFVYEDVMGLLLKGDIEVGADTTVDDLITDIFNIFVRKYLVGLVEGEDKKFSFASVGYPQLDDVIIIDGKYFEDENGVSDYSVIEFKDGEPVLSQINNILGTVFVELVPGFKGEWTTGDYSQIGDNVRKLVKYIAENSGADIDTDVDDDVLMLEILKIVFQAADTNGEKEVYNAVKHTETLTEMVNCLVVYLSGKDYSDDVTYEHVLGDWIIEKFEDVIPLYAADGKTVITANGKYTVWEVLNSVLNFFLVDKNLNAFFGMSVKKSDSYFDKLDEILDFTAKTGEANFESEKYINDLVGSILSVDLQSFIELTAKRALDFAGEAKVVTFLYNLVYNLLNNWSKSNTKLNNYSEDKPFDNTLSNAGVANLAKVFIETLSARSEGAACLVGLIVNFITDINEKVELRDSTCTAIGYRTNHKTCLKCNKVYLKGTTIAAKGHKYNAGVITKKPTCTAKGTKTYTCTVCGVKKYQDVAAAGHKATGYKTTKAATYKTKGLQVNKCTVCGVKLGEKILNMLTLNKPSGLKATALSTTSIKFSWNKVAGAESYTLYYRAGSGKWKAVNAKNKTNVTVKKLKTGTTYKFKVVAVAGSNKSKDSSIVSASTKPSTVTLKALRSKKKKEIIAEWKKISGVTGYEVQYSTSKKFTKKTTKTVTVKKQSTYKTIIKKLKSKKKYYVRVRAYKTVNKVKVYGAYSKVKNIKCK